MLFLHPGRGKDYLLSGGREFIVDHLLRELVHNYFQCTRVYIPFSWLEFGTECILSMHSG